jgi:protein-disulfide isomerase
LLLMAVFAVAGVAVYMSNTAIATMNVDRPVTIALSEATIVGDDISPPIANWQWTDDLQISQVYGGETVELALQAKNLSNVDVTGKTIEIVVTNDNNDVVSGDITSIQFFDVGASPGSGNDTWQELSSLVDGDDTDGVNTYLVPVNLWSAGTEYVYPVKVTFGIVDPAEYTVVVSILN